MMGWCYVVCCCFFINGISGRIRTGVNDNLLRKYEVASPDKFLASLSSSGTFVFTGLRRDYEKAVRSLRKSSPNCLQESLEVELEDGSRRFTIARDSETDSRTFPLCVQEDIKIIQKYFDIVDNFVMDVLKYKYNTSLQISDSHISYELEDLPTKSHLHVYEKETTTHHSDSSLSLPFHTDNGLYLLLTPSDILPLRTMNRQGAVMDMYANDDSLIFLAGSGLTTWLLPEEDLYAPPHAVPSITNSEFISRTVFARMKVAPLESVASNSEQTFRQHFYSSLKTSPSNPEEKRHQARLRRQVGTGHAQHWIGQSTGNSSSTE